MIRPAVRQPFRQHGGMGDALLAQHCQRGIPVTSHRGGSAPDADATAVISSRPTLMRARVARFLNMAAILPPRFPGVLVPNAFGTITSL